MLLEHYHAVSRATGYKSARLAQLGIPLRDGGGRRRRPIEPARAARRAEPGASRAHASSSTTAGRSRSRTRSSGTWRRLDARPARRRTHARRCCSGCSTSRTARADDRRRPLLDRVHCGDRGAVSRTSRGEADRRLRGARRDGGAPRRARVPRRGSPTRSPTSPFYAYTHVAHEGGFDLVGTQRSTRGSTPRPNPCPDRRIDGGPCSLRAEPDRLAAPRERARAVANRAFADEHDGSLVLRIDDTDPARRAGGEAAILPDLEWLGVAWDDGPCGRASAAIYAAAAERAPPSGAPIATRRRRAPRRVTLLRADGTATYHSRRRRRSRARHHARHPRVDHRPTTRSTGDRARARWRDARGDPPRARPRPGRQEALEAARRTRPSPTCCATGFPPRPCARTSTSSVCPGHDVRLDLRGSDGSRSTPSRR